MRQSLRGFWLSEILASVWILTFVGAGLLGLFLYLAKTSKIANERAAAELLAENVLGHALRIGPPSWGLLTGQIGEVVVHSDSPDGIELSSQLRVHQLEKHRLGILYHLSVEVVWSNTVDGTQVMERGHGSLIRERDIYVEDLETGV